ncbi:MAG: InlB B-repeat-containing protein [Ruminococcus sp.]|nr:InlB B-repeat-containing protein [Ruminococcus sp.]
MKKKVLCLLLVLMTALTMLPMTAHAETFTITVKTNGSGTVTVDPEQPEPDDKVTVTAAADEGWAIAKFTYEDSDGEFGSVEYGSYFTTEDFNVFTMPADNVTVTVDFVPYGSEHKEESCIVSFDPNGGEGFMEEAEVKAGESYTLPECSFTKAGAAFIKWEVNDAFYDPDDEISVNSNTTVKAIWKNDGAFKIDNSVDKSTTEVEGKLVLTDTKTGEVTERVLYDEVASSAFTQPSSPTVNVMIEEAKDALTGEAYGMSGLTNISLTVSDPQITETNDSRSFTTFEGGDNGSYLIIDGYYYHRWQYTVTLTADYTPVPMSYFSVWMSDTEQHGNTGGGVVVSYQLPDGTEPDGNTSYWSSSANITVPEGSQVTLTAEPYAYLGYRFAGWYQANINKTSPDDPTYLADKLISTKKTYTFTDNPVGEGESPYICAVFEDTGVIRQGDQIQVWITDGGKAAVEYTPSEPNTYEFEAMDGTDYVSVGEIVRFYKGDEITVHQQAEEGYVFKGWYHVWIDWGPGSEHPKYEGDMISSDPTFTYRPGETVVEGDDEPLRYVCAVFERAQNILGDVDGNGAVESIDVTYIQRQASGMENNIPFEMQVASADADGSGAVDIMDASLIQRWLAGLRSNDNIGKPIA